MKRYWPTILVLSIALIIVSILTFAFGGAFWKRVLFVIGRRLFFFLFLFLLWFLLFKLPIYIFRVCRGKEKLPDIKVFFATIWYMIKILPIMVKRFIKKIFTVVKEKFIKLGLTNTLLLIIAICLLLLVLKFYGFWKWFYWHIWR